MFVQSSLCEKKIWPHWEPSSTDLVSRSFFCLHAHIKKTWQGSLCGWDAGVALRYGARLLWGRARVQAPLNPGTLSYSHLLHLNFPNLSLSCFTCFVYQLEITTAFPELVRQFMKSLFGELLSIKIKTFHGVPHNLSKHFWGNPWLCSRSIDIWGLSFHLFFRFFVSSSSFFAYTFQLCKPISYFWPTSNFLQGTFRKIPLKISLRISFFYFGLNSHCQVCLP